ncbi:type II secretion system protein [Halobacteriales archaeon QS_1_68_20]|nr:MAG: type II secretion system protein [Halobacteriales archaeon QS_1_68_20]
MVAARVVELLARAYPWPVSTSERLRRSLAFLGWAVGPETVVRAGYGAALVAVALAVPLAALSGLPPLVVGSVALASGMGAAHAVHVAPVTVARLRRTSALGEAPDLVGRAVLRMRIAPTPEGAAAFAAETGDGPLAESLAEHVRRAAGTPTTGFGSFADEWADWFPSLRRAVLLVEAAGDAPPTERGRTLDRALSAVLDGTRDHVAEFAGDVRGPATGLYGFGVLLPLALASVLPAAGVAGLPVSLPVVVAAYDVLLPLGLVAASVWLLSRRPVAFRPPSIPHDHPDLPDGRWPSLAAGGAVGVAAWFVAGRFVAEWAGPLAGVGSGTGVVLVAWYRHEKAVRDRTRRVERHLPDALYVVGRRVDEGTAVEAAVARAAAEVAGATGDVLADAARRQRQLRVGVEEALVGEYGPLADLPSARGRSTASMLGLAASEGRPAGTAAVAMADHLEELRDVEADARAALSRVTGTLASTATTFAPMVGGVTVALAEGLSAVGDGPPPLSTAGLGLAVGSYVLLLAVILSTLSVGLSRGLDRALVGYRCGLALVSATVVYLAAFVVAGVVV